MAVLAVAIVVVLAGLAAFLVWLPAARMPTNSPPPPRAIGVSVARTSDGSNWSLLLVSVPSGLSPYSTTLAVQTRGGASALIATPFASLNFARSGAAYIQAIQGNTVSVGDRLLLSTSVYFTGYTYQLSDGTSVLAVGALQ